MKNKTILLGILSSLVLGIVMYLVMNNIMYAIVTFVVFLLYFVLFATPKFSKLEKNINKYHECYYFMNNIVVALNINHSITASLDVLRPLMSDGFIDELNSIKNFPEAEKIKYLSKYFGFGIYKLFAEVVEIWQERGGDIIKMSTHVINQSRLIEEYISFSLNEGKKKLFEFAGLWAFALLIMSIMRYSLTEYYVLMLNNSTFKICLASTFLILLVSLEFMFKKMTTINMRGFNDEKKIR